MLDWLTWLGLTFLTGLVLAPVFHGMPPRAQGCSAACLDTGSVIGYASSWAAQSRKLRLPRLVPLFAACVTLVSLLLITLWGLRDLRQLTAQRMPPAPIGTWVPHRRWRTPWKPNEPYMTRWFPTLTDYQRLRFHRTPAFRPIRPVCIVGRGTPDGCGSIGLGRESGADGRWRTEKRIAQKQNPATDGEVVNFIREN